MVQKLCCPKPSWKTIHGNLVFNYICHGNYGHIWEIPTLQFNVRVQMFFDTHKEAAAKHCNFQVIWDDTSISKKFLMVSTFAWILAKRNQDLTFSLSAAASWLFKFWYNELTFGKTFFI